MSAVSRKLAERSVLTRALAELPLLGLVGGCFVGLFCAENAPKFSEAYWLLVLPTLFAVWTRWWKSALFFGAWALFWGLHGERLTVQNRLFESLESRGVGQVELQGVICKRVDSNGFSANAWIKVEDPDWRGAVVGLKNAPEEILPGDRVSVTGELRLPPRAHNPGEMDLRQWYRRMGLAGELEVGSLRDLGPPEARYLLIRWSWIWREAVSGRLVAGIPVGSDEALLIKALVLGNRSEGGDDLFGPFRKTGTMHVFAVSGLHVGLVAILAWLLVRVARIPRSWGLWLVILIIWAYAGVTGLRPPVVRAATMGTFVLLGFVLRRKPAVGNALLASVPVVLMMDTYQWRLPGFQLSYAVVAVIILLSSLLMRSMKSWVEEDPFLPRALYTEGQKIRCLLREKLGALLAVSVTAWLGSFPLMRWYFGVITPIAVPASMILVPLVFVILALAFGGLLLGAIWPEGGASLNRLNGVLVRNVDRGVDVLSRLPGGQLKLREHGWGQKGLLVLSHDDGGAAAHLDAGGGVLVDAGSQRTFYRVVRPALRSGRFSPDSLVLTHPDGAHVGGAIPSLEEWECRQIMLPTFWARSPAFRALLEQEMVTTPSLLKARSGTVLPLQEDVFLEIVQAPTGREDRPADDRGLVVRLQWKGWKVLFTGDAGFLTEKMLLASGADVAADIVIMGRHESDFSGLSEFIQSVGPQVIISSNSGYNQSERVPGSWKEEMRARGVDLWLLSETGAVEITPDHDQIVLRAFLQEERRVILRKN